MNRRGFVAGLVAAVWPFAASAGEEWVPVIYDAAARHGADGDQMVRVARCESGLNAWAVSNRLNVNGTHDLGLFQINELTWADWSAASGLYGDPMDGYANAELAAWAFGQGLAHHWVCQ